MRKVQQSMVDDCVKAYADQQSISKKIITTGARFDSKKLADWLNNVAPHCSEIHVKFGVYTDKHSHSKKNVGRETVFFCACDEDGNPAQDDSGEDIPPVNQGEPYP